MHCFCDYNYDLSNLTFLKVNEKSPWPLIDEKCPFIGSKEIQTNNDDQFWAHSTERMNIDEYQRTLLLLLIIDYYFMIQQKHWNSLIIQTKIPPVLLKWRTLETSGKSKSNHQIVTSLPIGYSFQHNKTTIS